MKKTFWFDLLIMLSSVVVYFGIQLVVVLIWWMALAVGGVIAMAKGGAVTAEMITDALPIAFNNINTSGITLMSAVIALPLIYLICGGRRGDFGLRVTPVKAVAAGAVLGVALSFLLAAALSFIDIARYFPEYNQAIDLLLSDNIWLSAAAVGIAAPFCEELIFRGIVQRRLLKHWPPATAVFAQAALFGLIHFNLLQSSYAFLLGLALGLVCLWADSVWASFAVHAGFNLVSVVISSLPSGGQETQTAPDISSTLIIGAAALLISSGLGALLWKWRLVRDAE